MFFKAWLARGNLAKWHSFCIQYSATRNPFMILTGQKWWHILGQSKYIIFSICIPALIIQYLCLRPKDQGASLAPGLRSGICKGGRVPTWNIKRACSIHSSLHQVHLSSKIKRPPKICNFWNVLLTPYVISCTALPLKKDWTLRSVGKADAIS